MPINAAHSVSNNILLPIKYSNMCQVAKLHNIKLGFVSTNYSFTCSNIKRHERLLISKLNTHQISKATSCLYDTGQPGNDSH